MNKLSELQLENIYKLKAKISYLSDLIEQLYDMSCLEDMINDLRSGEDDEMLLSNLSLKSEVMEVLTDRKTIKDDLKSMMTEDAVRPPKHNGSAVTSKHYVKAT